MLNGWPRRVLRRRIVWSAAGAAIVAAAAVSVTLAELPSTATAAAGQAIPAAAIPALRSAMLHLSRENGDSHPASIMAVATIRSRAALDAVPGTILPARFGKQTAYLVILHGTFTDYYASPPVGAALPTGHWLTVAISTSTFQVLDLGLRHQPPPIALSRYGPVSNLLTQQ
jgi:hypothetical protein